jgi:ABC-2 type transport system permease protein
LASVRNIYSLGVKELRSLESDFVLILFVAYAFTGAIYVQATGTSSEVNNASIAFVDEDGSALSKELMNAFYPPRFQAPELITAREVEPAMDRGRFMFVVVIPPLFEHDLRAGRNPDYQVNIDATAMQQAGIGANYIKSIISSRIATFMGRGSAATRDPIDLVVRKLFNPNGQTSWFTSVVAIINQITLLTVVLTGAAVIREREHGTLEHLLVMPLTAFEIALAKVWANGLVILGATAFSLFLMVQTVLQVPFAGSVALWFCGVVLYLFFATALGIFLGTISR